MSANLNLTILSLFTDEMTTEYILSGRKITMAPQDTFLAIIKNHYGEVLIAKRSVEGREYPVFLQFEDDIKVPCLRSSRLLGSTRLGDVYVYNEERYLSKNGFHTLVLIDPTWKCSKLGRIYLENFQHTQCDVSAAFECVVVEVKTVKYYEVE